MKLNYQFILDMKKIKKLNIFINFLNVNYDKYSIPRILELDEIDKGKCFFFNNIQFIKYIEKKENQELTLFVMPYDSDSFLVMQIDEYNGDLNKLICDNYNGFLKQDTWLGMPYFKFESIVNIINNECKFITSLYN